MDMSKLAYETKAELEDHFAVCKAEETRRFGTTSQYRLSVKIDGNRIMVRVGANPSDEVVSAYGKTRQHMGRTIPFPSAAAPDAVNAEKSVENRARQAVAA